MTTPLFGLGLVDSMPDSFFTGMAAGEPIATRGIANIVSTVLPNDRDVSQSIGGQRVGRFGWKAGVPNLLQFSGRRWTSTRWASPPRAASGASRSPRSRPNRRPTASRSRPAATISRPLRRPAFPPATDDSVGSCAGGITLIQKDIDNFKRFMTNLAPPPRDLSNSGAIARGTPLNDQIGCGPAPGY